jgi:hypothetical protein
MGQESAFSEIRQRLPGLRRDELKGLFQKLISDGAPAVRALKDQTEDLDFDCKRKRTPGNGSFEKEDKQNLGITLSAFANSMGGLLLWGVDARRDMTSGLDVISDFYPIADLKRFESEARTVASEALMPRISNVEIRAIAEPTDSGIGYLAMYVERSDRRPHRCEIKDVKDYYRRSTSSSRMMEHFEIEDAFKRVQVPELEVDWSAREILRGPRNLSAEVQFRLKNSAMQTARFPYFGIKNLSSGKLTSLTGGMSPEGYKIIHGQENDYTYFSGGVDAVVNPEMSRPFLAINVEVEFAGDRSTPKTIEKKPYEIYSLRFDCRFGCENSRAMTEYVEIKGIDILKKLYNR